MNPTSLRVALAAASSLAMAGGAVAQPVDPAAEARYQRQLQDYQGKQQAYEHGQAAYQASRDVYAYRRDVYDAQRADYARTRADYQRRRADYDARYGVGAWDRAYGYSYRRDVDDPYRYYRASPCERDASNAAAGGVIGAVAGAAIGSSVAGPGERGEGAVLGALAGGALGASVASGPAHCDTRGYYFTYNQTIPYREPAFYESRYSGRYDYDAYRRMRCRLAAAPADADDGFHYRYARVCPDGMGRYRFTS